MGVEGGVEEVVVVVGDKVRHLRMGLQCLRRVFHGKWHHHSRRRRHRSNYSHIV